MVVSPETTPYEINIRFIYLRYKPIYLTHKIRVGDVVYIGKRLTGYQMYLISTYSEYKIFRYPFFCGVTPRYTVVSRRFETTDLTLNVGNQLTSGAALCFRVTGGSVTALR